LLIFQDTDLHNYLDRFLIPLNKVDKRKKVKTSRGTPVIADPQKFRPDAVLLSRDGRPWVLEAKRGSVNSEADCEELVVQTLIYADIIISPRWNREKSLNNNFQITTYDFLLDLYEAHWHLKGSPGKFYSLEKKHQDYFNLQRKLEKKDFEKIPYVLFLLEDVNRDRLKEACERVKQSNFDSYKNRAEEVLHENSRFRKRLGSIKNNWEMLQQIKFHLMKWNTAKFAEVIEGNLEPIL